MRKAPYTIFVDRDKASVDGFMSVLDLKGNKIFDRLPIRSGQAGYTKTSWESGKSPIPYSSELPKPLRVSLQSRPFQEGEIPTAGKIGEFWPVYNVEGNTTLIQGSGKSQKRLSIGIHPENAYKGSAGCVVILHRSFEERRKMIALSKWAKNLIGKYDYIELVVL